MCERAASENIFDKSAPRCNRSMSACATLATFRAASARRISLLIIINKCAIFEDRRGARLRQIFGFEFFDGVADAGRLPEGRAIGERILAAVDSATGLRSLRARGIESDNSK